MNAMSIKPSIILRITGKICEHNIGKIMELLERIMLNFTSIMASSLPVTLVTGREEMKIVKVASYIQ